MTSRTTIDSSAESAPRSIDPLIPDPPTSRSGCSWACSLRTGAPPSDTKTTYSSMVEMATMLRVRPRASPSDQPAGTPSNRGSGVVASSDGATTNMPASAPVASWNQTTPDPSRVGHPARTPTGSKVTCRRSPVARFHAYSWYEPDSVEPMTMRSGSSAAHAGKERMGERKRRSQAGWSVIGEG